jgi:hypothetical protein
MVTWYPLGCPVIILGIAIRQEELLADSMAAQTPSKLLWKLTQRDAGSAQIPPG